MRDWWTGSRHKNLAPLWLEVPASAIRPRLLPRCGNEEIFDSPVGLPRWLEYRLQPSVRPSAPRHLPRPMAPGPRPPIFHLPSSIFHLPSPISHLPSPISLLPAPCSVLPAPCSLDRVYRRVILTRSAGSFCQKSSLYCVWRASRFLDKTRSTSPGTAPRRSRPPRRSLVLLVSL